jgi:hypothetical protein
MNKTINDLAIIAYLIPLAQKKGACSIGYKELCEKCNLELDMQNPQHSKVLADSLTRISESEHENGRPLLSAIVFDKKKGLPGNGFFTMATNLKKYNGGNENDLKKIAFFSQERDAVYNHWQNPIP